MPTRPRLLTLLWGALCLALFVILALLIDASWAPVIDLDDSIGEALVGTDTGALHTAARIVEEVFEFWPFTAYSIAVVLGLVVKGYRRAAVYSGAVFVSSGVLMPLAKAVTHRARPDWQLDDGLLTTLSYPSGHATHAAAFFGVAIVLFRMFLRKAAVRRLATTAAVVLILLIGLDRLVLGRHHFTDVIAGYLLGIGLVLVLLVAHSPEPRLHAVKAEPLPEVFPASRRLAVVLNPIKVEDEGQFRSIVESMAAEAGWNAPRWYLTTVDDSGTGQAEQAAFDGADLVLVCGGDGTVREVCAELAGTGIPVGIIPAGTGNLLARNLSLPLYLRSAIDVGLNGQDRAIDMVEVEGDRMSKSHFLVMAGMGFDAAIMSGVNEHLKKKVGWIAYVLSGLKALMFPAVKVEISIDGGEPTVHRARTIVVGNVGTLTAGMPLLPDAEIDDGLLDVVLLHPRKFLSWLPLAFRILAKRPRTDDMLMRMTGHSVVVRADRDTPRQLDGDPVDDGRELRMTNVHGRLLVRVPRGR